MESKLYLVIGPWVMSIVDGGLLGGKNRIQGDLRGDFPSIWAKKALVSPCREIFLFPRIVKREN